MEVEMLEERPSRLRSNEQVQRRQRYRAHRPGWRKPLWGYFLALPFIALSIPIPLLFDHMGFKEVMSTVPVFLVTAIIAWIWGTGPAIFATVLAVLEINFFFIPPRGSLTWGWPKVLPLLFFLFIQVVIILITAGRESARQQALLAQQELEERARELEEANTAKDRFLSMASHELRTPVTLILTEVQFGLRRLAKQREVSPSEAALRELLEQVNQQARQLQKLIADILDLSLLGGRRVPFLRERCDLNAICQKIIEKQHTSSGRPIDLQAPSTPIIIDADCGRIGQVITNLVTNAIKYSSPTGTIVMAISQSETECCIQVHNDGPPIPSEQQEHLFEPFYRAPNAQVSQKEGCGLGLAISKEIVELHGGRIWVKSSQEKGTTFFVQLPLKAPPS